MFCVQGRIITQNNVLCSVFRGVPVAFIRFLFPHDFCCCRFLFLNIVRKYVHLELYTTAQSVLKIAPEILLIYRDRSCS